MRKIMCRVLVALFTTGLFYFPAISTARSADVPNLNGKWVGYYEDGTKSEYVWAIRQTGSTLAIENVGGKTAKSKGHVEGNKVIAQDFATQKGKLSADGTKITWTDGVVWKKSSGADLNGKWIGYYEDGSKSEYVWAIRQTGSALSADGTKITWTDGVVWKKQ